MTVLKIVTGAWVQIPSASFNLLGRGSVVMLVIVGESGSGKSSVVKHFVNSLGFRVIVSYTTRKPREGEVNGVDYHFVSDVSFEKMRGEQFFAEVGVYNGWYYGSAKEDYIDSRMKIAVLTPHGLRQVRKSGISVCVVYLKVPRRNRLIKLLQRGDSIEEAYRRNLSDVGQFDGVEDEVDLVIENDGYRKSIEEIANEIKAFYYT